MRKGEGPSGRVEEWKSGSLRCAQTAWHSAREDGLPAMVEIAKAAASRRTPKSAESQDASTLRTWGAAMLRPYKGRPESTGPSTLRASRSDYATKQTQEKR